MRKHIPNILTSLNLFTGSLGIIFAFELNLVFAAWMIFIAAVFDFLDGFTARLLNARSDIGKDLDSLADIVSFGLLPGIILFRLLAHQPEIFHYNIGGFNYIAVIALILPVFSALRLAKFNNDDAQISSFKGLPTPASAILIASIILIGSQKTVLFTLPSAGIFNELMNWKVLLTICVLLSILMVSKLPLFSLKLKGFRFKDNKPQYILILISLLLLILFQFYAIPLILIIYIIMSLSFKF